ncbi:MAG TPA: coenzyme F420-0:L-glutamate ligase [Actinomycetota bacterium]|nr:coenzyme F420-0:L-glutamate ligase [Actinomycetota bacterium]
MTGEAPNTPSYTPAASPVTLLPVTGIPEVAPGADLAPLIVDALAACAIELRDDDVLIVTQKIVSKAEGRIRAVAPDDAEGRRAIAAAESARVVRRRAGMIITETHHGFVCANAGIDASNLEPGLITLLPEDPDRSARRLRSRIKHLTGAAPPVIISDTFGRAWRVGQVNVAIGVAGMLPVVDYLGSVDHFGVPLRVTMIAIADELASAAELVMGKADGVPVAVARGVRFPRGRGNARSLVRPAADDLFR